MSTSRYRRAVEENDLRAFLVGQGVQIPSGRAKVVVKCMLHDDSRPSMSLDLARGLWKCFAGCGGSHAPSAGTVVELGMRLWNVGKEEAVHRLLRNGHDQRLSARVSGKVAKGAKAPTPAAAAPATLTATAPAAPAAPPNAAPQVLADVASFYAESLRSDSDALLYLESRGLGDAELIARFKLGFASGALRTAVSPGSEQEQALRSLGVLTERGGELLRGCVTVPLLDPAGEIVGMYGRSIQDKRHLFLPGPKRGLVNGEAARVYEDLVLVESVFGVLALFRAGIHNAWPAFGTQGWGEVHERALGQGKVKRIVLAFDRDPAGETAAPKVAARLAALGIEARRLRWPDGMPGKDANDFFAWDLGDGRRPSREDFEKLVAEAAPIAAPKAAVAVPAAPAAAKPTEFEHLVTVDDERAVFAFPDVLYTLVGLDRVTRDSMRLVVTAEAAGKCHTDRIDLYLSRSRRGFALSLQLRLELHPARVEDDLVEMLKNLAELHRRKRESMSTAPAAPPMTPEEEKDALDLLRAPDLLDRVGAAFDALGYVGEHANRVLSYLVGTSRLMEKPLSLIVRSSSAAGKSDLLEKTAALMPPEEVDFLSRITQAALYYVDAHHLEHHLLCFDERTGSSEADYAIRSLQSRRQLSVAVPIKTPSGAMRTRMITVYGPTAVMEATTGEVYDENSNRCIEAFLDESPEATRRIHAYQRAAWAHAGRNGESDRTKTTRLFQNAQRLLKRVTVQIPFADRIRFPAEWIRTRRDHDRFLALVGVSAFVHQYRREGLAGEPPVVLASLDDYAVAYSLAHRSLGSALSDLPAPVTRLLELIRDHVERIAREQRVDPTEVSFRRRDVREWTRLPDHVVKRSMRAIEDLEYIETTRRGRGSRNRYRLVDAPPSSRSFGELTTPQGLARELGLPILNDLRQKWDRSGTFENRDLKSLSASG